MSSSLKIVTLVLLGPKLISATFSLENNIKSRDGYGSAYGGYAPQYGSYPVAEQQSGIGGLDIVSDVLIGALAALAGLALLSTLVNTLGAAFAFFIGRKKRDLAGDDDRLSGISPDVHRQIEQMETLHKFIRSLPEATAEMQPQKIMAGYLTCSGLADDQRLGHCLERLACEFQNPRSNVSDVARSAMAVISDSLQSNKFVPPDFRRKLRKAAEQGKQKGACQLYLCTDYFKPLQTTT